MVFNLGDNMKHETPVPVPARVQRLCEQIATGSELEWRTALVELALIQGTLAPNKLDISLIHIDPADAGKVH